MDGSPGQRTEGPARHAGRIVAAWRPCPATKSAASRASRAQLAVKVEAGLCQRTTPEEALLTSPEKISFSRSPVIATRIRKWFIALSLVLLAGTFLFVFFYKPPALPEVMILPPTAFTIQEGRIPDRWIPAKWTWLQRACRSVFGPPKSVIFNIYCHQIANTAAFFIDRNTLGKPDAEGGGMALWILRVWKLDRLVYGGRYGMSTSLSADDRMKSTMLLGWRAEIRTDFFPRLDKETNDLSIRITPPSNFGIAVRVQIPHGSGLLFVDVGQPDFATSGTAIEITEREKPL